MAVVEDADIVRLREFDACTISDALDALGLPGAVHGVAPMWEGARAAGRVVTMSLVDAHGQQAEHHLGSRAIELAGPGDVIVVERADSVATSVSGWGGLLAFAAARREVGGVVVDGACRDVDEIRELGLPLFARAATPVTARRRVIERSVGQPIVVGGVPVETGWFVVADGSGLAFVAPDAVAEVLARAERISAKERLMQADLRDGRKVTEVLGHDYEELLNG